jgi:methylenetetrahydrofolate reductase (NADPH)
MDGVLETLSRLYRFKPDFISCTYGAGGGRRGKNMELCRAVTRGGHEALPHFTCVGNTRDDVKQFVTEYLDGGYENLLALRGDLPAGWEGTRGDFSHADGLIAFLGAEFPGLCMGAAAYPEKHLAAPSLEADIARLRSKQDSGAQFCMTQLCYDTSAFERFIAQIRAAGITMPIIAGLMPVLNRESVIRMTLANGCSIPADLSALMGTYEKDPQSFTQAGKEYTAARIRSFMALGINGLHLYTMNKWAALTEILLAAGIGS